MERVLYQSWQWVRAWLPPGLTAIALVGAMVGLWFVMMEADRSLASAEVRTEASRATAGAPAEYRQAKTTSVATEAVNVDAATSTGTTECMALQKEIDAVSARARASVKSKQGTRFRTRLRELKDLYGEECAQPGFAPAN